MHGIAINPCQILVKMKNVHFTEGFLKNVKPDTKLVEYYDTDLVENNKVKKYGERSLILRVNPGGKKSFVVSYWYNNSSHRLTIGPYPRLGLSEARRIAKETIKEVKEGVDPKMKLRKEAVKEEVTLSKFIDIFIKNHVQNSLKESTQQSYTSRLNRIKREFSVCNESIKAINRENVRNYIKKVSEKNPTTANRIHSILSSVLSMAVEEGLLEQNPILGMKKINKEKVNDVYYRDEELKAIWEAIEGEGTMHRCFLKILLLTGRRKSEVLKSKWENIDTDGEKWIFPDGVSKSNFGIHLPLTNHLKLLLEELQKVSNSLFVFPSPQNDKERYSYTDKLVKRIRIRSGVDTFNIHDLRHTVGTRLSDLGVPFNIVGMVLNHKTLSGSRTVTARYIKSSYMDEKLKSMNLWDASLMQIVNKNNE